MYNFINRTNYKYRPRITGKFLERRGTPPQPIITAKSFSLFSQPYLDRINNCYKNIVVINLIPKGPLADIVKFIHFPPLSEFKQDSPCNNIKKCGYVLSSLDGCNNQGCDNLMVVDEIPNLMSYLMENGYTVDTSITKMFNQSEIRVDTNTGNKLICYVTYNG